MRQLMRDKHGWFVRVWNNGNGVVNDYSVDGDYDHEEKKKTVKEKFENVDHFYDDNDVCFMLFRFNEVGMIRKAMPGQPALVYNVGKFERISNMFYNIQD